MKYLIILLLLTGCGSVGDYIVETPGGNVYVPEILNPTNLITCKKVAYCIYETEWEECKRGKKPQKVHVEMSCIDLAREEDAFFIPLDVWESDFQHEFIEVYSEHLFKILNNIDYIKKHTSIYKNEIPKMVEKFQEFHKE